MTFNRKLSALMAGACFSLIAGAANAATLDWIYSAPSPVLGGANFTGNGTLTYTEIGGKDVIQTVTGELSGNAVTLLAPGAYHSNDNLIFPTSSSFLDGTGFGLGDALGDQISIWGFYAPGSTDVAPGNNYGQFSNLGFGVGQFNVASVPEPTAWIMMMAGFGGLGMALRRIKSTKGAAALA
jgi:PEP-CTERM motif